MLCPKCSQLTEQVSVAVIDSEELPVYQCDACRIEARILNCEVVVAFTFAVTPDGRFFDPNTSALLNPENN